MLNPAGRWLILARSDRKDARIEAIITKNGSVAELKAGDSGEVVLDRTVIYAESGGQMADTGAFRSERRSHRGHHHEEWICCRAQGGRLGRSRARPHRDLC